MSRFAKNHVLCDDLIPRQQTTQRAFRVATNFYLQWMTKHSNARSEFHSYAEYLHAGLLEGDPTVIAFVPQPFSMRVGKRRYQPDVYVAHQDRRRVLELRPNGKMDERIALPLTDFFSNNGMTFELISNESVYERQVEAENWLAIVRILYTGRNFPTTDFEEQEILNLVWQRGGGCALGDIVDTGDRETSYNSELTLFRLLHEGCLRANLDVQPLSLDTELRLCG